MFDRRDMGLYDLPRPLSLLGFSIGIIFAVFQICGMELVLITFVNNFASEVFAFFPRCFRWRMDTPSGPSDFLFGASLRALFISSTSISVSSPISLFIFLSVFLFCALTLHTEKYLIIL